MWANFASCDARRAREGDDPRLRRLRLDFRDDCGDRRNAPALELGRRQDASPGIEDLHGLRPRRDLAHEIGGRGLDEPLDQRCEQLRLAVGEQPRRRLVRRAAPGDHVTRDRPRRAAEADQRDGAWQRGFHPVERLEHRREFVPVGLGAEARRARRRR